MKRNETEPNETEPNQIKSTGDQVRSAEARRGNRAVASDLRRRRARGHGELRGMVWCHVVWYICAVYDIVWCGVCGLVWHDDDVCAHEVDFFFREGVVFELWCGVVCLCCVVLFRA